MFKTMGWNVGWRSRRNDGREVGGEVGADGGAVGMKLGADGITVGVTDGADGIAVGARVGRGVGTLVGAGVGAEDGSGVGAGDGAGVGTGNDTTQEFNPTVKNLDIKNLTIKIRLERIKSQNKQAFPARHYPERENEHISYMPRMMFDIHLLPFEFSSESDFLNVAQNDSGTRATSAINNTNLLNSNIFYVSYDLFNRRSY